MLTAFFDAYATRYQPYKRGHWCYEDGCLYRGLELLHRATGEERWLDHLLRLITPQIRRGSDGTVSLAGYDPSEYNIDNILSGRALLYLAKVTGDPLYLEAAALLASQLRTHPRTRSGVYWHKLRYPWQIWLDGLYMAAPFQVGYGMTTNSPGLIEDSLSQLSTALSQSFVPATGLYAHATDEAGMQPWALAGGGHSRAHWARALGWLAMCLVDVATLVGPERFAPLQDATIRLMRKLMDLRQPSGLWLQVIDQPQLSGNFEETSASAMLVYALLQANKLDLCPGFGEAEANRLLRDLCLGSLARGADGTLQMARICEVAGLGRYQDRYRDGSAEYYVSERVVADDIKGVGPLMMAVACGKSIPQIVERDIAPMQGETA